MTDLEAFKVLAVVLEHPVSVFKIICNIRIPRTAQAPLVSEPSSYAARPPSVPSPATACPAGSSP